MVKIGFFSPFHCGTEWRIRNDEVKSGSLKPFILRFRASFFGWEQSVRGHDVGVPVVVNDHVHLCRPGDLFVDFDPVKIVLGEIVPMPVMFVRPWFKVYARLSAHLVQRMEQEAPASAGGIKHH